MHVHLVVVFTMTLAVPLKAFFNKKTRGRSRGRRVAKNSQHTAPKSGAHEPRRSRRESAAEHRLTVWARDQAPRASRGFARVLVRVRDADEHAPAWGRRLAEARLPRGAAPGALVAALRARQADDDHVLQTVVAFRQLLTHPATAEYLVARTGTLTRHSQ